MLGQYTTCPFATHYSQSGAGADYFTGQFFQNGYGLGNLIGSIFKTGVPLLKRSAPTIAKTALNSLCDIGNEVLDGGTVKGAIKKRIFGQDGGGSTSGYIRRRKRRKIIVSRKKSKKKVRRIKNTRKRKKSKKKKKRTASRDIFT